MKFDAVIGNPPYQVMDGGNGVSSKPIYNTFVQISKQLNPNYLSMIMPSRWYAGGKGLDDFRKEMLNDKKISVLVDFPNCNDVFPNVDVAGGICYFLHESTYNSDCKVINYNNSIRDESYRKLNSYDVFIRSNKAITVINKVIELHSDVYFDTVVSSRKPFGLPTNYKPLKSGQPCWFVQKIGLMYANKNNIIDTNNYIDKWKLLAPKAPIAGQTDFTKPISIYYDSNTIIAKPNECCTESFIILYNSDKEEEVINARKYIFGKFAKFLLLQRVISQDITRERFKFVPLQDFTENSDIDWTKSITEIDQQLYKKYKLTQEEIDFIESMIKPME